MKQFLDKEQMNTPQKKQLHKHSDRQCALYWWNKQSKNRKHLLYQNYRFSIGLQNNSIHRVKGNEIDAMYLSLHVA